MRTFPLNLAAFVTAAALVIAVSFAMVQAGVFSDDSGGDSVTNPTQTPAALADSASPVPTEPVATGSAGRGSFY